MRHPKYKVGDIVQLLPYEDFNGHIGIPQFHWHTLSNAPQKISFVDVTSHHTNEHGGLINGIYYGLGDGYSFCEEFLEAHILNFLNDKDFEI